MLSLRVSRESSCGLFPTRATPVQRNITKRSSIQLRVVNLRLATFNDIRQSRMAVQNMALRREVINLYKGTLQPSLISESSRPAQVLVSVLNSALSDLLMADGSLKNCSI